MRKLEVGFWLDQNVLCQLLEKANEAGSGGQLEDGKNSLKPWLGERPDIVSS